MTRRGDEPAASRGSRSNLRLRENGQRFHNRYTESVDRTRHDMRTTKTLSVSLPPSQLRDMARTARKENRTISDLVGELYWRYVSDEARREFARAVGTLRTEAARTPAAKLTMRQIDAEIAAARRERKRKPSRSFASSSIPTSSFPQRSNRSAFRPRFSIWWRPVSSPRAFRTQSWPSIWTCSRDQFSGRMPPAHEKYWN